MENSSKIQTCIFSQVETFHRRVINPTLLKQQSHNVKAE